MKTKQGPDAAMQANGVANLADLAQVSFDKIDQAMKSQGSEYVLDFERRLTRSQRESVNQLRDMFSEKDPFAVAAKPTESAVEEYLDDSDPHADFYTIVRDGFKQIFALNEILTSLWPNEDDRPEEVSLKKGIIAVRTRTKQLEVSRKPKGLWENLKFKIAAPAPISVTKYFVDMTVLTPDAVKGIDSRQRFIQVTFQLNDDEYNEVKSILSEFPDALAYLLNSDMVNPHLRAAREYFINPSLEKGGFYPVYVRGQDSTRLREALKADISGDVNSVSSKEAVPLMSTDAIKTRILQVTAIHSDWSLKEGRAAGELSINLPGTKFTLPNVLGFISNEQALYVAFLSSDGSTIFMEYKPNNQFKRLKFENLPKDIQSHFRDVSDKAMSSSPVIIDDSRGEVDSRIPDMYQIRDLLSESVATRKPSVPAGFMVLSVVSYPQETAAGNLKLPDSTEVYEGDVRGYRTRILLPNTDSRVSLALNLDQIQRPASRVGYLPEMSLIKIADINDGENQEGWYVPQDLAYTPEVIFLRLQAMAQDNFNNMFNREGSDYDYRKVFELFYLLRMVRDRFSSDPAYQEIIKTFVASIDRVKSILDKGEESKNRKLARNEFDLIQAVFRGQDQEVASLMGEKLILDNDLTRLTEYIENKFRVDRGDSFIFLSRFGGGLSVSLIERSNSDEYASVLGGRIPPQLYDILNIRLSYTSGEQANVSFSKNHPELLRMQDQNDKEGILKWLLLHIFTARAKLFGYNDVAAQKVAALAVAEIKNTEDAAMASGRRIGLNKADESSRPIPQGNRTPSKVGGIDLNAANLDLYIKRDGNGVPLPVAQQDWVQMQNIPGFIPVIIDIRPAINSPILSDLQNESTQLAGV